MDGYITSSETTKKTSSFTDSQESAKCFWDSRKKTMVSESQEILNALSKRTNVWKC